MKIYTIGHYNHSQSHFLELLNVSDIDFVADIRAFPASRNSPQYNQENMEQWLKEAGINYGHFPNLGGRRTRSGLAGEKLNAGWDNRSFHNYADYTLSEDFKHGIEELKKKAESHNLVLMCSERHPSRCHRLIISNWLQANDWEVIHIIDDSEGEANLVSHKLGKWGAMPIIEEDGTVVYPNL